MKAIILILALFITSISQAQFISTDDKLHFGAGAIISTGTYSFIYIITKSKKKAFWYSFGTATLAGLVKEVYDSGKVNNKFDPGEMFATSLGGLTASTTINLFVGNKKKKNMVLVN